MTLQSYSWEGEDVLVRKVAADVLGVRKGFYVDVGAHHPFNLSNTALLYAEGWRGINIDAMPGSMDAFREHRPDDINLEVGVSDHEDVLQFSMFSDPGLNGFLPPSMVGSHEARGERRLGVVDVRVCRLDDLLREHAGDRRIDLMSIDLEGLDERVLASLDPSFRPSMVLAEVLRARSIADAAAAPITRLMEARGYAFFSRMHFSCLYIDREKLR